MLTVGLTGGIGSGKSEVAGRLVALGAVLVDSDAIAREVVASGTDGLRSVVAEFGDGVLLPDGSLDREALGRTVFSDPDARARLNAIVHPLVGDEVARQFLSAAEQHPDGVLVNDVPLLVEGGLSDRYDVVVVVDAPVETQVDRLVSRRGMREADARARIAAQATREQRLVVADHVIDNGGPLDTLQPQVEQLWAALQQQRPQRQPSG